jgi:hypothetical protein
MKPKAEFYQVLISSELRTQGMRLLEHLISSWGDLSRVQPQDPTR